MSDPYAECDVWTRPHGDVAGLVDLAVAAEREVGGQ